jgi:ribonuclease HI
VAQARQNVEFSQGADAATATRKSQKKNQHQNGTPLSHSFSFQSQNNDKVNDEENRKTTIPETDPLLLQPSMSTVGTRRRRTEQGERRTIAVMNELQIRNFGRQLRMNDLVRLQVIRSTDHPEGEEITGMVAAVSEKGFTVKVVNNGLDGADDVDLLTFPGEDGELASALLLSNMPGIPKFKYSPGGPLLTKPQWIIFCDGSGAQNGTTTVPCGAAIVVKHVQTGQCWVFARFHPATTNNVCEWASIVAAFRFALMLPGEVAVCSDSELAVKQSTGAYKVRAAHIKPYYDAFVEARQHSVGRCTLHQIEGHDGPQAQIADAPAKLAVSLQRDFRCTARHDDEMQQLKLDDVYMHDVATLQVPATGFSLPLPAPSAIFPEIVQVTSMPKMVKRTTTTAMRDADAVAFDNAQTVHVTSLEEYILMRSFPARAEPPRECREQWAAMVKTSIERVLQEADAEKRNQAMLDFLVLPNIWLPTNVPTRRIIQHFHTGVPFSLNLRTTSTSQKTHAVRLAEMISRRAKNHDLRGATRILRSESDQREESTASHEARVEALRAKFPDTKVPLAKIFVDEKLPIFPTTLLHSVVRKMRRTAAPGIDGWQKMHLQAAVSQEPKVAEDFCVLADQILRQQFSPVVMNCLRAARLVPLPKPDNGVRPVAVSNFFCKIIGQMSIRFGGATCAPWQYAVGKQDGTKEIIHKLRQYQQGGMHCW